jgi:PTS system cellobiose-specific IIB component
VTNILVVCGAGASSTFLAHRMRTAATARGYTATVKAASQSALDSRMPGVDVLLVGPHLAAELPVLARIAEGYGVPVALLPESIFGSGGEHEALSIAIDTLRDIQNRHEPDLDTLPATITTENHS